MERYLMCLFLCSHILTIASVPIHYSEDDIAKIIHFNNRFSAKKFLLKLLKVKDEDDSYVTETSTRAKVEKFSIKETTCLISDTVDVENCDFKPDGVVMKCEADIITDEQHKSITGQCLKDTYAQEGEYMEGDVIDKTQENFEFSVQLKKIHYKSCLSCLPDFIRDLQW